VRLRDRPALGLRKCPACSALNRPGAHECAECRTDLRTPQERRETEVRLEQDRRREAIARLSLKPRWWQDKWAGADERRLALIAEMRGFKPGWVHFQRQRALAGDSKGDIRK
jgi:hypothetical protein